MTETQPNEIQIDHEALLRQTLERLSEEDARCARCEATLLEHLEDEELRKNHEWIARETWEEFLDLVRDRAALASLKPVLAERERELALVKDKDALVAEVERLREKLRGTRANAYPDLLMLARRIRETTCRNLDGDVMEGDGVMSSDCVDEMFVRIEAATTKRRPAWWRRVWWKLAGPPIGGAVIPLLFFLSSLSSCASTALIASAPEDPMTSGEVFLAVLVVVGGLLLGLSGV